MAAIDYPCRLPGVLVNSNGYRNQDTVRRNDLQSGPPIFRLESEDQWVLFDVAWKFSALEVQVFRNFHRNVLASGSKLFNIELMVDGFDGIKQTKTHECFFDGAPQYTQNGRRWTVAATLLAIESNILDECDGISLVNSFDAFDNLNAGIVSMDEVIILLEDLWIP